jgi:hypothetical protein
MKITLMILVMLLLSKTASLACSVLNEERIQVGSRPGIKGTCSNNGLPVTCFYIEGEGVECDGPSGGYTGKNLESLIFSACGCSVTYENEQQLKRELEKK